MTPDDLLAWGCAVLFLAKLAGLLITCFVQIWKPKP
jgi:hypothetical protein